MAPKKKTMLQVREQHHPDSTDRLRRTLEELLIGMQRRNQKPFEFLNIWEEWSLAGEATYEPIHAAADRERVHSLMVRLMELVVKRMQHLPTA